MVPGLHPTDHGLGSNHWVQAYAPLSGAGAMSVSQVDLGDRLRNAAPQQVNHQGRDNLAG